MQSFAANLVLWMDSVWEQGCLPLSPPFPLPTRLGTGGGSILGSVAAGHTLGKAAIDHSGRRQKGHASYYAAKFAHRKMADGNRLNPQAHIAASKTLPLGTRRQG